jgi:alpha-beta hydrolase superfamily lysophospholipase
MTAATERDDVRIPSGDGELAAWVYRPEDDAGPVPAVVLMHGLTATREERLWAYGERFADAGIASVIIDFRHFGESSGSPRQLIDLDRQDEDCNAALVYARNLPGIDPDRVAIWGTSFAGGCALTAAARHPWLAAAVCQTPMLDGKIPPPGMTRGKMLWLARSALRDTGRALLGRDPFLIPVVGPPGVRAVLNSADAWSSFEAVLGENSLWRNEVAARVFLKLRQHRPIEQAGLVGCPLLLQIVDLETVVRNEPSVKAAERAPRGELREYAGLNHFGVYVEQGFERLVADQIDFLRKHLTRAG